MVARFMAGTGVGMASMLSPMYISEIAPAGIRGRLVAMNQLTVVLGIFITNLRAYSWQALLAYPKARGGCWVKIVNYKPLLY